MASPCLLALLCLATAAAPSAPPEDPELAAAIRLAVEGDFENALPALDAVANRLARDPARSKELARAYLYMGVAYIVLGQQNLATSKFRQALDRDGGLRLSPDEFPQKVLRVFEATLEARRTSAALAKEAKKKPGKRAALLLVLGGAAAAGIAVAVAGERANSPPTASFTVSPQGQALVGATRLTFTASANDPDGEPLRLRWSFGDGTSAEGSPVTHVYGREGNFEVALTVSDGLTSTEVRNAVTARSLTGVWRVSGHALPVEEYRITQTGNSLVAVPSFAGDLADGTDHSGSVTDPRGAAFVHEACRARPPGGELACLVVNLVGQADPGLQTIVGISRCAGSVPLCGQPSRDVPVTLTRQ